ncbi:MAG: hypothetical protein ACKVP3_16620 [Hyphomicrobiaceae bacterium]
MDYDLLRRRDDLARDLHSRRELDKATPSIGPAGLIVGAIMLLVLGVMYFGQPAAERTHVASGDGVEATAPLNSP